MIRTTLILSLFVPFTTPLFAQQASWVWVNPYPTGEQINQLYFKSSLEGFLLGNRRVLLRTTDAGNSWHQTSVPINISSFRMFFISPTLGWVIGSEDFAGAYIMRTSDGGVTWSGQPLPGFRTPRDLFFLNSTTGWIVGDDGLMLLTTDGGVTWQDRSTGGTSPPSLLRSLNPLPFRFAPFQRAALLSET